MKANFSRLTKPIFVLVLIGGTVGLSYTLTNNYLQTQETQQLERAKNLLERQKYAEAIAVYDRLLETSPSQAHLLWINRGYAWSAMGKYDRMLDSCTKATEIEPQAPLAWNCRGEALYGLNKYSAALQAFQQAIAIESQKAIFWLNKSTVLAELQRHAEALTASETAVELFLAAKSRDRQQRYNLAEAYALQGESLLKLKRNRKALSAFAASLEYAPQNLSAQQGLGIALYRLNRCSDSAAWFAEILQRDDLTQQQQATNWLYRGVSLCKTPQTASADRAFAKVLELTTDPQIKAIASAGCGIR